MLTRMSGLLVSVVVAIGIAKATQTPEPESQACVEPASTLIPIHQGLFGCQMNEKFSVGRIGEILNINEIRVDSNIVRNDFISASMSCPRAFSK